VLLLLLLLVLCCCCCCCRCCAVAAAISVADGAVLLLLLLLVLCCCCCCCRCCAVAAAISAADGAVLLLLLPLSSCSWCCFCCRRSGTDGLSTFVTGRHFDGNSHVIALCWSFGNLSVQVCWVLFLNALYFRIWKDPYILWQVTPRHTLTHVSLSSSYAPWRTWKCRTTKLW